MVPLAAATVTWLPELSVFLTAYTVPVAAVTGRVTVNAADVAFASIRKSVARAV